MRNRGGGFFFLREAGEASENSKESGLFPWVRSELADPDQGGRDRGERRTELGPPPNLQPASASSISLL